MILLNNIGFQLEIFVTTDLKKINILMLIVTHLIHKVTNLPKIKLINLIHKVIVFSFQINVMQQFCKFLNSSHVQLLRHLIHQDTAKRFEEFES